MLQNSSWESTSAMSLVTAADDIVTLARNDPLNRDGVSVLSCALGVQNARKLEASKLLHPDVLSYVLSYESTFVRSFWLGVRKRSSRLFPAAQIHVSVV